MPDLTPTPTLLPAEQISASLTPPPLALLVPPRGLAAYYVGDYIGWPHNPITDAPLSFHLATVNTLVGLATVNKAFINWAGQDLRPNISCLLMADSAEWRKTTALNLGVGMLRDDAEFGPLMGSDEFSAEALLAELLSGKTTQLLAFPEMLNLFSVSATWGSRLPITLMTLMDCPVSFRVSLKKGKSKKADPDSTVARNVRLAVFGAANMDGLNQLRDVDGYWSNGFFSRFLMVAPASENGTIYTARDQAPVVNVPRGASKDARRKIVNHLRWMAAHALEFTGLSQDAEAMFVAWQNEIKPKIAKLPPGYSRFVTHAVKVAMGYNIDLHTDDPVIQVDSLDYAIRFCNMSLDSTLLLRGQYTPDKYSKDVERILRFVQAHGEVTQTELLLMRPRIAQKPLDEILHACVSSEELVRDTRKTKTKPATVYRLGPRARG